LLGILADGLVEEQRDRQCAVLGRGQLRADVIQAAGHEICQGSKGQPRLAAPRATGEHAPAEPASFSHAGPPERRLADARFTFEHEGTRFRGAADERGHDSKLAFASKYRHENELIVMNPPLGVITCCPNRNPHSRVRANHYRGIDLTPTLLTPDDAVTATG
jgi:hypothetical protein